MHQMHLDEFIIKFPKNHHSPTFLEGNKECSLWLNICVFNKKRMPSHENLLLQNHDAFACKEDGLFSCERIVVLRDCCLCCVISCSSIFTVPIVRIVSLFTSLSIPNRFILSSQNTRVTLRAVTGS